MPESTSSAMPRLGMISASPDVEQLEMRDSAIRWNIWSMSTDVFPHVVECADLMAFLMCADEEPEKREQFKSICIHFFYATMGVLNSLHVEHISESTNEQQQQ